MTGSYSLVSKKLSSIYILRENKAFANIFSNHIRHGIVEILTIYVLLRASFLDWCIYRILRTDRKITLWNFRQGAIIMKNPAINSTYAIARCTTWITSGTRRPEWSMWCRFPSSSNYSTGTGAGSKDGDMLGCWAHSNSNQVPRRWAPLLFDRARP